MGRVAVLFHAERWVSQWRAVGGILAVAPGRISTGGNEIDPLLELGPTFPLAEPWDSPGRRQVAHLRAALAMPRARDGVIEFLKRQRSTGGFLMQSLENE